MLGIKDKTKDLEDDEQAFNPVNTELALFRIMIFNNFWHETSKHIKLLTDKFRAFMYQFIISF